MKKEKFMVGVLASSMLVTPAFASESGAALLNNKAMKATMGDKLAYRAAQFSDPFIYDEVRTQIELGKEMFFVESDNSYESMKALMDLLGVEHSLGIESYCVTQSPMGYTFWITYKKDKAYGYATLKRQLESHIIKDEAYFTIDLSDENCITYDTISQAITDILAEWGWLKLDDCQAHIGDTFILFRLDYK
jgi:hypothetical protein